MSTAEHPFAQYVRILGKGKNGTRSLDYPEAEQAFAMILSGQVEPLQLGAFLMLLRVKEESAEELAGFVSACRHSFGTQDLPQVDLDWSSYAGKRRQQPWYILSALLLAENGIRVLMHGSGSHTPDRLYSEETLVALGIHAAGEIGDTNHQLADTNFSYLPLQTLCPPLDALLQLKPLLGLRSPINTLVRMLNPAAAKYSIQSVFHPAYAQLHAETDRLLGQPHSLVIKGDGGEVEIKPQADTRCTLLRDDRIETLEWPRQLQEKQPTVEVLSASELRQLWEEDRSDSSAANTLHNYGILAVIETTACALLLLQRCDSPTSARDTARQYWQQRNRKRFQYATE